MKLSEDFSGNEILIGKYCSENYPPKSSIDSNLNEVRIEIISTGANRGLVAMVEYEALHYKLSTNNEIGK